MNEATPDKHHRWGPSSLKNREICPGWRNDKFADTTKADEGTKMHLAWETNDLTGLDAEQTEQVQKCINYCSPLEKIALEVHKEKRLSILRGLTFGTADRVIIRMVKGKKHADLIDGKFGRRSVDDASDNRQGWSYLIGVFDEWRDVESVTVHFLLPRRDEVLKHTFYRKDIPRISAVISAIIKRADHYDKTRDASMLNPTEYGCLYCGNRARINSKGEVVICPALGNYGFGMAARYENLPAIVEVHSSQITDPQQMADIYTAVRVLEKMVDSVKKHVSEFAREHPLPGYELRSRKGSTKITNPTLAYPILKEILDPVEIASCAEFSFSKIEKLVSDKAPKGKKSAAVTALYTALSDAECVFNGEGSQYLQRAKEEPTEEVVS